MHPRAVRRKYGWEQRDLAVVLGVSHGAVGRWESGSLYVPGPCALLLTMLHECRIPERYIMQRLRTRHEKVPLGLINSLTRLTFPR